MTYGLSRREALVMILGAPLATEACRFLPKKTISGSIRGDVHELGHRLRDGTSPRPGGAVRDAEIVIVGGGPSGLSAAWRLERAGESRYVVLDLESIAGGTSAFGTDGVVPYPWGAHYVPVPHAENRACVELLREVGALESSEGVRGKEGVVVREPEERLFFGGAWYEGLFPLVGASRQDIDELQRFTHEADEWAKRRDSRGRRAFTIPIAQCSDDAEFTALDRLSAAAYLERRGYRSARLRWFVEYACRDDYGLRLEQTSAWAMLFYFASRVPSPGAPSAPLLTWPEGNGRLVRHMTAIVGSRLQLGNLVTDIAPRDDAVDVTVFDSRERTVLIYRARHVIVAVPKFVTARIMGPWREKPPAHLHDFTYGSWMVANVHLRERPKSRGFPFAWDNVLYDSPSLGYVVATHQRMSDFGPTIWTYYQPYIDEDPKKARQNLLGLGHKDLTDALLADLGRAHINLENAVERIDVWRWGHAMIRPIPGFLWGRSRRKAADSFGRVQFAHTDLSGVALFEEAQYHGVRAAEAVLTKQGRSFTSFLG